MCIFPFDLDVFRYVSDINKDPITFCPICGYPARTNDMFVQFGGTCPYCAFQFGIDESNYGDNPFMKYRALWISKGLRFMTPSENPHWTLEECIENLNNLVEVDISNYFPSQKVDNTDWKSSFDIDLIVKFWNNSRGLS